MRRFASLVSIFLLLAAAAPVLACVAGGAMTHEESACCHAMRGQCGEMASWGCCRTDVRTDDSPQIAATSAATSVNWICVAQLTPVDAAAQMIMPSLSQLPDEHSPPGLLTARIAVLRI